MIDWIINNWIEIVGSIFSLIFLYLEYLQKKIMWGVGILSSSFYVYIFYISGFYADMWLSFYYILAGFYGWILWSYDTNNSKLIVNKIKRKLLLRLIIISIIIYIFISYILKNHTDSNIIYWDALTTTLGIIGTWMLAKRILEVWLLWIFVNLISFVLYFYKGLYPSFILYIIYTIISIFGYFRWKKF